MSRIEKEEKTKGELLAEQLCYKPEAAHERLTESEMAEAFAFAEKYKAFLNAAKTEREAVAKAAEMAEKAGFVRYVRGAHYAPGAKVYAVNRGKAIYLMVIGSEQLTSGVNITAAHLDAPRLDLKVRPLYEEDRMGFFKTHYYGGIKKYQWTATPLALHGVVAKKDGTVIPVCIGEDPEDPVFCVTDLLPHLAKEQDTKPTREAIVAEKMNVLIGTLPFRDDKASEKIKLNLLSILYGKYGMTEADFLSADLTMVPAFPARDVGLDRSLIGAYAHDDRVCGYTALSAILEENRPRRTCLCALVDREEIGSDGTTGMQSDYLYHLLADLAATEGVRYGDIFEHSACLSADVTAAYDPNYGEAYDKRNCSELGLGVAVVKYTGAGGKYNTSEAGAEYMAEVRRILDDAGVQWQTGSMGRVDLGGGGTVAKYIANRGIDTVDVGVPVLSMHAPFEVVAKTDVYMTWRAFAAFQKR